MDKIRIPKYSLTEEVINSTSHGVGALLSMGALLLLLEKAQTKAEIITCMIYGITLIILYSISCIYHGISKQRQAKKVFRILDHCSVLLLEAGTYTPICICLLPKEAGYPLLALVWSITLVAMFLDVINLDRFYRVELTCNLLLGWSILWMIKPLVRTCPQPGILLLFTGGLLYTFGALLYKLGNKKKYMHSIFHFFVIAGSILHFLLIYNYIL